ncbi:MAG: sugar ABC transporter permease [Spirochaetales bacterium]|nr:sugar ABC transporter permease [Spirochaetales bacterium]
MITYNDEKKTIKRRDRFRNYQTGVISGSMKVRNRISNGATYIVLIILNIIALTPLVYLVGQSFRAEAGAWSSTFFPKTWTLANYKRLFTETPFLRWYVNTFFVAVISCAITTAFVLAVSYAFSRIRFKLRRPMMNVMLVLGMFPGFMSMTAVYFLLKILLPNHFQSLLSLIIVYSAGAALSYYVAKGFFDTVPKSLDEAAFIDGATRAQIFWKITIPLSKPIVIYTILISFIAPWCDFIFVSFIMSGVPDVGMYTVSLGMYKWLEREQIQQYFTTFCAAATLVAIPITALFIWLQKYYVEGITGGAVKG